MLRDILSSKAIQAGFVFFVLVVGSSLLYSWHVHHTTAVELTSTDQFLQQLKKNKKVHTTPIVLKPPGFIDVPEENEGIPLPENVDASIDNTSKSLELAASSHARQTVETSPLFKEVRESPFGLGPYPEIPAGWDPDVFEGEMDIGHELIERVRIKLFTQGTFTYGGSISHKTGLVYPVTMDTVYVEFGTTIFPELGERRYIQSIIGHPTIVDQIKSNARSRDLEMPEDSRPMLAEDVPQGVQVLSKSDGIDPYVFLDLK